MESTAFFEKKISLTPKDFNKLKSTSIEDLLLEKAKEIVEAKCSEQGFILPGSIKIISRSMGYFEPARFTGDAVYYVKLEGQVIYPVDGIRVIGEVIRKNKMGMYVIYKDAIRIQVPRDLHLGNEEYEEVNVGDNVEVELKRSKFQINDPYILASGIFVKNTSETGLDTIQESDEDEENNETTVQQETPIVNEEEEEDDDEESNQEEEEDEEEESNQEEEEDDDEESNQEEDDEEESNQENEKAKINKFLGELNSNVANNRSNTYSNLFPSNDEEN